MRMDTQSVNAFSSQLKPAWESGYHDGFYCIPDGEKRAKILKRFPILMEVYLLGYKAGKKDANNGGKWTDRGTWADAIGE